MNIKNKYALFFYGIVSRVYLQIVGRLVLSEVIALLNFRFKNLLYLLRKYPAFKYISVCYIILLISQVFSDIYNNTVPNDYLRGISVIIFSYISTVFFLKYIDKNYNSIIFYLISVFIVRLFFGEEDLDINIIAERSNFFKQRFVGFLNVGVMLIAYFLYKKKQRKIVTFLFFIYAILCIVLDARSNGLIFLISALIIFIKNRNIKLNKSKVIFILFLSVTFLYVGYVYYINKVLNNEIGGSNSKTQIAKMSNPYNPFELLYYGRLDTYIAVEAIKEKPIMGYGSWAVDKGGKYRALVELISGNEVTNNRSFIPSHSIILGAWLYAGFLGFLAIFLMFKKLFGLYYNIFTSKINMEIMPIITVLTADMLWASIFSPFGQLRTSFPIFASLIIFFEARKKK